MTKGSSVIEETKRLLSEEKFRIEFYDFIDELSSRAVARMSEDTFTLQASWSADEFATRLTQYEDLSSDLVSTMTVLGHWGLPQHAEVLALSARHFGPLLELSAGPVVWSSLHWYPILLQGYALGIGAVAAGNYPILRSLLHIRLSDPKGIVDRSPLVIGLTLGVGAARDRFKALPDRDRQFTPMSEYLFELLQPWLNDVVFMGTEFEAIFDRFELLFALEHGHLGEKARPENFWGPIGRFGWKYRKEVAGNPVRGLLREASESGQAWPPLKAGFFDGSIERYQNVADAYVADLQRLGWH